MSKHALDQLFVIRLCVQDHRTKNHMTYYHMAYAQIRNNNRFTIYRTKEKNKSIKFVLRIINNILNEPNNEKYQNI